MSVAIVPSVTMFTVLHRLSPRPINFKFYEDLGKLVPADLEEVYVKVVRLPVPDNWSNERHHDASGSASPGACRLQVPSFAQLFTFNHDIFSADEENTDQSLGTEILGSCQ